MAFLVFIASQSGKRQEAVNLAGDSLAITKALDFEK